MTKQAAADIRELDHTNSRYYSPATLSLAQSLLATLANIELEFEQERDKIRNITDTQLRGFVLERLEAKYLTRREPYVRHLTLLQTRVFPERSQESAAP
jgi:hypothetical protein